MMSLNQTYGDKHFTIHITSSHYTAITEMNIILYVDHISKADLFPFTLGERFREIVCPSLLKKEMGDLVLAIRTAALSSAFRSKASVKKK